MSELKCEFPECTDPMKPMICDSCVYASIDKIRALQFKLKAAEERVRVLEEGMREIMVSVGRVEPKDGHPEFGYIYSVAKALLKGE